MSNKYSRGKIYKVTINDLTYYGSTTEKYLTNRLAKHKNGWQRWKDGKHGHCTCFNLFEFGSPEITLLEMYPCKSRDELHARERHYIENNECVNKIIPTRTCKEWYDTVKYTEEYQRKKKAYYEANRDDMYRRCRERITASEESYERYKQYGKEYREKNREQLVHYDKERHKSDHRKKWLNTVVMCDCGVEIKRHNLSRHKASKKHQNYIAGECV